MSLIDRAREIRAMIKSAAAKLDDTEALSSVPLFPRWSGGGVAYTANDRVQYNDVLYRCLTSHTSQDTWTPTDAPSLWTKVLIPGSDIPAWEQPDSTNPYAIGDKVTHNGQTWVSTVDNNVWEPGVYGWEVVE
jgi:hypothetical protein